MANSVYAMSDLHGHFNKFIRMLRKIEFDETDKMLLLGNIVNGGPQPIELLFFISQQENMRMSLGRHEIIMLEALLENNLQVFDSWINTLDGRSTYDTFNKLDEERKHYFLNFLKESCVAFFTTDDFFLSSCGLDIWDEKHTTNSQTKKPELQDILKKEKSQSSFLISNSSFYQKAGLKDRIIIFGDVPVQQIRKNMNYKIWHDPIYHDKICINSGVGIKPHKLACLRLNDMAEFYI